MLKMKVFFSIFPILALYCCVTVAGSRTANESCCIKRNVSTSPGKLVKITGVFNGSFNISYDGPVGVSRTDSHISLTVYGGTNNSNTTEVTIYNGSCTFHVHINISDCPLGLHNIKEGGCTCPPTVLDRSLPDIKCDNSSFKVKLLFGYCASEEEGNSHHGRRLLLVARCPLAISDAMTSVYMPINHTKNYCRIFNRHKQLCSDCIDKYGISVYSDTFECVKCNRKKNAIVSYIAIEIIPTTIFFLFILYFHIKVTSGPANGYIFFAQTMTSPFEVIFLRYIVQMFFKPLNNEYLPQGMVQSIIIPYCIWNLDFYRFSYKSDICLSHDLRPMDILALHYISTLYPFLLLVVCYVIIELQAMNFRPVLWMLRIICFPCLRWKRVWKAKISILDTFAACLLLTYYKVMYVTFLLFSVTNIFNFNTGSHTGKKVLGIDPSIELFSKEHLPFFFLAIVVFLTFGLVPPLLLTFYQFKTCYTFLERAKLKRPGLEQFVLAFQSCYKDGTNGTPDRRFFAGIYFVFRLVMVMVMTLAQDSLEVFGFKIIVCIIFVCVCAITQPYKQKRYTIIDCIFFFFLAVISGLQYYIYVLLQEMEKFSRNILINQLLMYMPLLYIIMYVSRWLFICFKNRDSNPYLLLNDGELKDTLLDEREDIRQPVHIDISPRNSVTRTEVSIAELSQENDSESDREEEETSPLLEKRREMKIFSQHAATESQEYSLTKDT